MKKYRLYRFKSGNMYILDPDNIVVNGIPMSDFYMAYKAGEMIPVLTRATMLHTSNELDEIMVHMLLESLG